jgi:hypothetical protein
MLLPCNTPPLNAIDRSLRPPRKVSAGVAMCESQAGVFTGIRAAAVNRARARDVARASEVGPSRDDTHRGGQGTVETRRLIHEPWSVRTYKSKARTDPY